MSPLLVRFLRRLAAGSLVVAVLLAVGPSLLREFGLVGPSVQEILDGSARAVEAARLYGATEELPSYVRARKELERARELFRHGEARRARHAAREASAHAIVAQRQALAGHEEQRRRAQAVVAEIDSMLNALEDLYDQVKPGTPKGDLGRLLSLMKGARQVGAGLILSYEQGNYAKVLAEEQATKDELLSIRRTLAAVKR